MTQLLTPVSTDVTLAAMNARKRLDPETSRDEILKAAARVALRPDVGLFGLTRDLVMAEADRSAGLVSRAFGTMEGLRDAVLQAAIENGRAELVADGLCMRLPLAKTAPESLLREARAILSKR